MGLALPACAEDPTKGESQPCVELASEDVVLFQGASIVEAGRDRENALASNLGALGHGFAMMASMQLLGAQPALRLRCFNRGIGGNQVPDLDQRWQEDCLDLAPRC